MLGFSDMERTESAILLSLHNIDNSIANNFINFMSSLKNEIINTFIIIIDNFFNFYL